MLDLELLGLFQGKLRYNLERGKRKGGFWKRQDFLGKNKIFNHRLQWSVEFRVADSATVHDGALSNSG